MSKTETQLTLKKRKQNPDDGELDITPMIDITFLLLAFFVVVSKMDPQQAVDLPRATFGVSVQDIKAEGNVKVGLVETVRKGIAQAELSESRKLYAGIKEEQK